MISLIGIGEAGTRNIIAFSSLTNSKIASIVENYQRLRNQRIVKSKPQTCLPIKQLQRFKIGFRWFFVALLFRPIIPLLFYSR
jgi:hypothetical protein